MDILTDKLRRMTNKVRWKGGAKYEDCGEVMDEAANAFIADILEVCHKHQLWLAHEDEHGGFIITNKDVSNWINDATIGKDSQ